MTEFDNHKQRLDKLAYYTVTIWLILSGLSPTEEFDPMDDSWITENLPYRIWTIPAKCNDKLHLEQEKNSLEEFLAVLKALQGLPNFGCYQLRLCDDSDHTILYTSIYVVI